MAKEDDLKIVELKVSVNCCQGCRRQVMKALSTKGVLKTEIHPTLPKVTVYGSVDAQTLIKKLAKRGKTAGLWPSTESTDHKISKDSSIDETKPISNREKDIGIDNSTIVRTFKDEESPSFNENDISTYVNEDHIKDINGANSSETSIPDAQVLVTQVPPNMASMASHARVFYPMEPTSSTAPLVYYTVSPHYASNYVQEGGHHPYQVPVYHHYPPPAPPPPPLPAAVMQCQAIGFSDYFNDDNTVGCQVM